VHPQGEQEVKFVRKFLLGGREWERVGVCNLADVACVLKKFDNFFR